MDRALTPLHVVVCMGLTEARCQRLELERSTTQPLLTTPSPPPTQLSPCASLPATPPFSSRFLQYWARGVRGAARQAHSFKARLGATSPGLKGRLHGSLGCLKHRASGHGALSDNHAHTKDTLCEQVKAFLRTRRSQSFEQLVHEYARLARLGDDNAFLLHGSPAAFYLDESALKMSIQGLAFLAAE